MATAAAAVIAKARRDVISHFMERNAVGPASAVRWVPERRIQRRMLARFLRYGVLIETREDTYYLDVPAYDRWRRTMRKRAAAAVAAVAVIGTVFALLA